MESSRSISLATRPVDVYYSDLACRHPSGTSFMNTALKGYLDNGNNSGNDGTGDLVFGLGWIMGICFVSIAYLTTNVVYLFFAQYNGLRNVRFYWSIWDIVVSIGVVEAVAAFGLFKTKCSLGQDGWQRNVKIGAAATGCSFRSVGDYLRRMVDQDGPTLLYICLMA
ncbi:hypothetical protein F2Q69_00056123 [Brassica cretica]|uniref:Uncharacterized protein n=1 Tax=Brassica cretica TaxID=69181 RepID=A0A8S9MZX3_BRACR|nr:hypothetical protein F2Q69_00056123 [Brassica cretica]